MSKKSRIPGLLCKARLVLVFALVSTAGCNKESNKPADPVDDFGFYLGADLSYVNQMEDCGVVYQENNQPKDPYRIFSDNGCELVRIRLFHTPAWYDTLNQGFRYSDLSDVRKSIQRAKAQGMKVLLDFHLSDTWADPGRQLVPAAWLSVVNDTPALADSVYNYVSKTLTDLNSGGLLPEMVQIGNETNRGIVLSPAADAAGGAIDWPRNAALFNAGIRAVRDLEKTAGKKISVGIHIAGPANALSLLNAFRTAGVTDFDLIGLSYYWAWHQPTTISQTGDVIAQLKVLYPGKAVMIVETAYIWTTDSNDQANNLISVINPQYAPASPANQRRWLVDLTTEVKKRGGAGVVYWEPAWVTSGCRTPWGQGSHQENGAFFDFSNNVLPDGGMAWLNGTY